MKHVLDHPLAAHVLGHVCHATTLDNALSILADGRIKADTTRNGIHTRKDDAHPSVCMENGAVSVFDLGVSDDALFGHSPLHWWTFLLRSPPSVIILLDASLRERLLQDPQGKGQLMPGTEFCHPGDIEAEHFASFLLVTNGDEGSTSSCSRPTKHSSSKQKSSPSRIASNVALLTRDANSLRGSHRKCAVVWQSCSNERI